jgi:hypothetical protein
LVLIRLYKAKAKARLSTSILSQEEKKRNAKERFYQISKELINI